MTDALTQTTSAAISTADRKLAYKFAERLEAIEKASVEFCMDLAEAVDSRIEGSQNSFLTFACPRLPLKTAKSMVVSGRETARAIAAGRPATFYGWATYEVIASLPEEYKDWAYEEPRTYREIQAFKKSLKTPTQPTTTPTTTNDLPHHPAPTPQQQCVQADDWGAATVVTAEVVTMPDGEQDYQRAIQLFDEIIALSKRNFASGWTELQWNELGGYCRTFEGCCNARGRRNGSVAKKPVPSAPAFEPCLN